MIHLSMRYGPAQHRTLKSRARLVLAQALRIYLLAITVIAAGCSSSLGIGKPHAKEPAPTRSPRDAQLLVDQALATTAGEPDHALSLLRDAVKLDPANAQARNNLGVHLLRTEDLAGAAREFDTARRLLPHSPEPRLNLGVVYERAGRTRDALDAYAQALELAPDSIEAAQALVRLQIRSGTADANTARLLERIALHGSNTQWQNWARLERSKQGK